VEVPGEARADEVTGCATAQNGQRDQGMQPGGTLTARRGSARPRPFDATCAGEDNAPLEMPFIGSPRRFDAGELFSVPIHGVSEQDRASIIREHLLREQERRQLSAVAHEGDKYGQFVIGDARRVAHAEQVRSPLHHFTEDEEQRMISSPACARAFEERERAR